MTSWQVHFQHLFWLQGRDKDAAKREEDLVAVVSLHLWRSFRSIFSFFFLFKVSASLKDEEEQRELSQKDGAKKKLGKWERRQRRIAAAGKAAEDGPNGPVEEDDFLQPVTSSSVPELPASRLTSGNKKLKLRRDGSSVQAPAKHRVTNGHWVWAMPGMQCECW